MRITEYPIISEIKEAYIRLREDGKSRSDATQTLKNDYRRELEAGSDDDGLLINIGLADAQYSLKELDHGVAVDAVSALDKLEFSNSSISKSDVARRREWYAKAPMIERKKISSRKRYKCSWAIGDTFALQLCSKEAEERGFGGRYMLFRKVAEMRTYNGHIVPIVTVSTCDSKPLPATSEEFQKTTLLKLRSLKREAPWTDFEYRVEFFIEKERELKQLNLQYLGNFADVPLPEDEVIIECEGIMLTTFPELIETHCCNYLRNHSVYQNG